MSSLGNLIPLHKFHGIIDMKGFGGKESLAILDTNSGPIGPSHCLKGPEIVTRFPGIEKLRFVRRERLHPAVELRRDIDDKRRIDPGRQEIMIDRARPMRRVLAAQLDQRGEVGRVHHDPSCRQMIGVRLTASGVSIPMWGKDDPWTAATNDPGNFDAVFIGVGQLGVAPVETLDYVRAHDFSGRLGFTLADLRRPAGAHFTLRQVDYADAVSKFVQSDEHSPCADFDVIRVRADRENIVGSGVNGPFPLRFRGGHGRKIVMKTVRTKVE